MRHFKAIIVGICMVVLVTLYSMSYNKAYSLDPSIAECCQDYTKECWACQKKMTIAAFCALNPGQFNCPEAQKCCTEERKECIACAEDITEDEVCRRNPELADCVTSHKPATSPAPPCCQEQTKECLSCQKKQTVNDFCAQNSGQYGCPVISKCCKESTKKCLACEGHMSVKEFCTKNPGKYGCDEADIMVGILLSNKAGYTQFTSSVLKKYHEFPEEHIHIFNDASTEFNENNIREWYGDKVNFVSSPKPIGNGANLRKLFEYFSISSYRALFLVNEETIFLKEWKRYIETHLHNATDGFLSLYHSSVLHNYTIDCQKMIGDLCEGTAVGSYGVALTRPLVESLLKKHSGPFDNLDWTKIFDQQKIRLLYPRKALTMQIGQTNQSEDNCGQNEVAYRFNRCEFPAWIKNGIEFFFDRCTSPKEKFSPETSIPDIEKEGRFWTRPVISYSFYGERRRYTQIARENAVRAFSIYPGWKIWVYTDGSVPAPVIQELCELDVRFINMSQTNMKSKMSWRFLVASAPVKMYAVRDIDSWLLQRGKEAVDEWIKSGRKFHNMRDHPNHSRYPMSGGMWGGLHDAVPNMKKLLDSRQMNDNYMQDMDFLNNVIWQIAIKSVWTHDSHSLHKFGEDHPFPTQQRAAELFVGNVVIWPG